MTGPNLMNYFFSNNSKVVDFSKTYLTHQVSYSPTAFQAEITAIKKLVEMPLNKKVEKQNITFFSDSKASLAALNKLTVKSNTVEES